MVCRVVVVLILVFAVCCGAVGCGRAGAPKPPEYFAPATVTLFSATGTVNGVRLQFKSPDKQQDGDALTDLTGFEVYRADFVDEERPDFDRIAFVPYTGPLAKKEEDEKTKNTPKGLKRDKEKSTAAIIVQYQDPKVKAGSRYLYYVEPVNEDGVNGVASPVLNVRFVGEASQVELYRR